MSYLWRNVIIYFRRMIEASTIITKLEVTDRISQDMITLTYDQRCKRRCLMKTERGVEFLLNLPHAVTLQNGDAIELSDNSLILVEAAAEDIIDVQSDQANFLKKFAWYMGNKHKVIEIHDSFIRVQYDRLIEQELTKWQAKFLVHKAPFLPNINVYGL